MLARALAAACSEAAAAAASAAAIVAAFAFAAAASEMAFAIGPPGLGAAPHTSLSCVLTTFLK